MKFTEEDLKKAAAAVDRAMLEKLPAPEQPSPHLMARLEQLNTTHKRKIAWRLALSRVAACILVTVVLGGTWLAVDAEARHVLRQWLRDFTEDHYVYQFVDMDAHSQLPEYEFGWLPDGYESHERTIEPAFHRKGYGNYSENFHMMYFYPKSGSSYVIRPYLGVTIQHSTLTVGELQADLYHLTGSYVESRLVWFEPDSGILFDLSGDLPEKADLIRMMESLHPVE